VAIGDQPDAALGDLPTRTQTSRADARASDAIMQAKAVLRMRRQGKHFLPGSAQLAERRFTAGGAKMENVI